MYLLFTVSCYSFQTESFGQVHFRGLPHHLKDLGQYCTKGKSHSVPGETKNRELHLIPCSAQGEERQKLHSFPGRREEKHRVIYTVIRRETGLEYRKVNTS